MKKLTTKKTNKFPFHAYVWSLFIFSSLVYCSTIGMITFDVVGRKALNQDAQKIAVLVAKQEEVLSEKTKLLSSDTPSQMTHVAGYIDSRDVTAVGFAQ